MGSLGRAKQPLRDVRRMLKACSCMRRVFVVRNTCGLRADVCGPVRVCGALAPTIIASSVASVARVILVTVNVAVIVVSLSILGLAWPH